MNVTLKRKIKPDTSSIQKFYFLDNLQDSLRDYSIRENKKSCPILKRTNYKHHAEIHDITIVENGQEKSMLKLFEKFSVIIIPENKRLKIFVTSKDKSLNGHYKIDGKLDEFKKLLKERVSFIQGDFDEILFFD